MMALFNLVYPFLAISALWQVATAEAYPAPQRAILFLVLVACIVWHYYRRANV